MIGLIRTFLEVVLKSLGMASERQETREDVRDLKADIKVEKITERKDKREWIGFIKSLDLSFKKRRKSLECIREAYDAGGSVSNIILKDNKVIISGNNKMSLKFTKEIE